MNPPDKMYMTSGGPLRQSILRQFDACPLSARFDIDGYADYSTGAQAFGTVFHEIAKRIFIELRGSQGDDGRCEQQMSTEEAVNVAREVCADPAMPHLSVEQMDDLIGGSRPGLVIKFCERKWTPENFMAMGREDERLSADLRCPDGKMRTLTGLPDLVGARYPDGAVIVDLKTGWGVPPAPRGHDGETPVEGRQYLSARGVFQLDAYGLLVMRNTPAVRWTELFELHVRKNAVRKAVLTRDDLEHVEQHLGILLQRLDTALQEGNTSKLWEPRPGKHCSYCPRPHACPVDAEERGEYAITDDETADEYGQRYMRSQGLRDTYRAALSNYFAERGYAAKIDGDREIRFDGGAGGAFVIVDCERQETTA
jgi:hypothetical protein